MSISLIPRLTKLQAIIKQVYVKRSSEYKQGSRIVREERKFEITHIFMNAYINICTQNKTDFVFLKKGKDKIMADIRLPRVFQWNI